MSTLYTQTPIESRPYRIYRIPTGVFSGYFLRGTESGDFGSGDVLYSPFSRRCSRVKRTDQILQNTRVRDGNYENSMLRWRTRAYHGYALKSTGLFFRRRSFVTLFVNLELWRDWIAQAVSTGRYSAEILKPRKILKDSEWKAYNITIYATRSALSCNELSFCTLMAHLCTLFRRVCGLIIIMLINPSN